MEKEKNKDLNPVMARLLEFADAHGGFASIGRKIGKHPAMFYNLVRRNAVPSLATLQEIGEAYPELDMNYVIRGVKHNDAKLLSELQEKVRDYESALLRAVNMSGKLRGAFLMPDVAAMRKEEVSKTTIRNSRESEKNRKARAMSVRVQGAQYSYLRG